MLEIQILDLNPRVPYGLNNTAPMGGVLGTGYPGFETGDPGLDIPAAPPDAPAGLFPGRPPAPVSRRQGQGALTAFFSDEIQVPLKPFMGVMGVALPRGRLRRLDAHRAAAAARRPGLGPSRTVRRQHGPPRPDDRRHAVPAGLPAGRAVLHRRLALGAGRRRGERHGDRAFAVGRVPLRPAQGQDDSSGRAPRTTTTTS